VQSSEHDEEVTFAVVLRPLLLDLLAVAYIG